MKGSFFLCLLVPIICIGQRNQTTKNTSENGIHFESGLSWLEIQNKAKVENKYIFMDCYATWCGPCKFMADSIFTQKDVGNYMNEHFINVAVQMDQTVKDPQEVKKWYEDAKSIKEQYSVEALPTYLFFSPDGHAVHEIIGVTGDKGTDFISKAKESLDPAKQYFTILDSYREHLNDTAFLKNALIIALQKEDTKRIEVISNAYARSLRNHYRLDDLVLLARSLQSSNDLFFPLVFENVVRIDSVLNNPGATADQLCFIIANDDIKPLFLNNKGPVTWVKISGSLKIKYPQLSEANLKGLYKYFEDQILSKEVREPIYKKGALTPDWAKISQNIKRKHPGYDPGMLVAKEKPRYYFIKKMWRECEGAALDCADKYGMRFSNAELNEFAWNYIFLHSTDESSLSKALQWSWRTIPDPTDTIANSSSNLFYNADTYANLLYKLGHKERAIFWEKKALDFATTYFSDLKSTVRNFQLTLDRMQKGEPTWEGRNEHGNYQ